MPRMPWGEILESFFRWLTRTPPVVEHPPLPEPVDLKPMPEPIAEPVAEKAAPKYLWDTPQQAKHSVRVICDELGFTLEQKNTMCATIQHESGFNTQAVNYNKKDGKVVSVDWGICQWNDFYHGKEISPHEAVNDPEKAVRLMAAYWKRGQRNLWVAYSSGKYRQYL